MNCEKAFELLSASLDNALNENEQAQLQRHLEQCDQCCEILQHYQAIDIGLVSLNVEPPSELLSGVMAQIKAEKVVIHPMKKRRFIFGPGTAIAAVAAALVLVIGSGYLPDFGSAQVESPVAGMPMAADSSVAEMPMSEESTMSEFAVAADAPESSAPEIMGDIDVADEPEMSQYQAFLPADDSSENAQIGVRKMDMTIKLTIAENSDASLEVLTEAFSSMTMEEDIETGKSVYVTDVATAREILEQYSKDYDMELIGVAENTPDDALCIIELL